MTRVALLWHMHQPFYQDLATGEHVLPWVRLHAIKDYWGMVALLREFPDVKVTFNLVPSLLAQLESFASGEARDRHLALGLEPADQLSEDERAFCVEHFFHAPRSRMIDPYPRYAELLDKRGGTSQADAALSGRTQAAPFSSDDIRDLQVWHKLAWLDPFYLDGDDRVRALLAKGRDYTEGDKQTLRAVELELLNRVIPEYRDAAARGQVELSTSPFYHPILPLLCDTDVYLRTHPESRMPRERFRHPEDAADQLARAVGLHARLFGDAPAGVWPSEGSVSDDMIPLVAAAGFTWMASDEGILARTIGHGFPRDAAGVVEQPDALYQPYLVGAGATPVTTLFRDHALSDLVGFTYASWDPEAAALDFVQRLTVAGARYMSRTGREATIAIVLDGENAWEHYDRQGRPFLRALYRQLTDEPEITTVTMGEACRGATERLPSIFPGSWINSDFYIWIGHADDQRAWSQLAEARHALGAAAPGLEAAAVRRAREELLIAEGSDWFWWYGDDHSSDHDLQFDDLFRRHVRNVYRALERPIPEELFITNITTRPPVVVVQPPTGFISPTIDGEVTSYFEWIGAGCVDIDATVGAMHQVSGRATGIRMIEFGFDLEGLSLRVDGDSAMKDILDEFTDVILKFLKPAGTRVRLRLTDGRPSVWLSTHADGETERSGPGLGIVASVGTIVELRVPFAALGLERHAAVAFIVSLNRGTAKAVYEVEHHPQHRAIEFQVPDAHYASLNWTA